MGEMWIPIPSVHVTEILSGQPLSRETRSRLDFAQLIGMGTARGFSLRTLATRWGFAGVRSVRKIIAEVTDPEFGWCTSKGTTYEYAQTVRAHFGIDGRDALRTQPGRTEDAQKTQQDHSQRRTEDSLKPVIPPQQDPERRTEDAQKTQSDHHSYAGACDAPAGVSSSPSGSERIEAEHEHKHREHENPQPPLTLVPPLGGKTRKKAPVQKQASKAEPPPLPTTLADSPHLRLLQSLWFGTEVRRSDGVDEDVFVGVGRLLEAWAEHTGQPLVIDGRGYTTAIRPTVAAWLAAGQPIDELLAVVLIRPDPWEEQRGMYTLERQFGSIAQINKTIARSSASERSERSTVDHLGRQQWGDTGEEIWAGGNRHAND